MAVRVVLTGKIARFTTRNGYGFIEPDEGGGDIYVHVSDLEEGDEEQLRPGARVAYEVGRSTKGPKAVHVRLLADAGSPVAALADLEPVEPQLTREYFYERVTAIVEKHTRALSDELVDLFLGG